MSDAYLDWQMQWIARAVADVLGPSLPELARRYHGQRVDALVTAIVDAIRPQLEQARDNYCDEAQMPWPQLFVCSLNTKCVEHLWLLLLCLF